MPLSRCGIDAFLLAQVGLGHCALIARIGESGDPIFVGERATFTASSAGEIWLGVNDLDPGNNAGEFLVDVCLR